MKIYRCIKLTSQEKTAIETVQNILRELSKDNMICTDFEQAMCGDLEDIYGWFNAVVQYLADFGFGE